MSTPLDPEDLVNMLKSKASTLRASTPWKPSADDLARGHEILTFEFNKPELLPPQEFSRLAGIPLQQLFTDIAARQLLALSIGTGSQRIPRWQLEPKALQLTRKVLAEASIDMWTAYRSLTFEYDSLDGKSPISAVERLDPNKLGSMVLSHLGFE